MNRLQLIKENKRLKRKLALISESDDYPIYTDDVIDDEGETFNLDDIPLPKNYTDFMKSNIGKVKNILKNELYLDFEGWYDKDELLKPLHEFGLDEPERLSLLNYDFGEIFNNDDMMDETEAIATPNDTILSLVDKLENY